MSEQPGGAVKTLFESLKSEPLSLALVVMNICLLGYLYYEGVSARHERESVRNETMQMLQQCLPKSPLEP